MNIIIDIIYSLMFIGLGIAILKYRKEIKNWSGSFMWAEKILGRGGTYIILILAGIGAIFLGVIYPFGGINLLLGK